MCLYHGSQYFQEPAFSFLNNLLSTMTGYLKECVVLFCFQGGEELEQIWVHLWIILWHFNSEYFWVKRCIHIPCPRRGKLVTRIRQRAGPHCLAQNKHSDGIWWMSHELRHCRKVKPCSESRTFHGSREFPTIRGFSFPVVSVCIRHLTC